MLPCFCKLLEKLVYSRHYKYLLQYVFCEKEFGFQASNSMKYAVKQLVSQILHAFNENKYTVGIYLYLSKAIDTLDSDIHLEKLDMYGLKGKKLKMASQLFNKQEVIFKIL